MVRTGLVDDDMTIRARGLRASAGRVSAIGRAITMRSTSRRALHNCARGSTIRASGNATAAARWRSGCGDDGREPRPASSRSAGVEGCTRET